MLISLAKGWLIEKKTAVYILAVRLKVERPIHCGLVAPVFVILPEKDEFVESKWQFFFPSSAKQCSCGSTPGTWISWVSKLYTRVPVYSPC